MKNKLPPIVSRLLITAIFAFVYFYFNLPAINLQDTEFYMFVFLICAVYCFLSIATMGLLKIETVSELVDKLKKNCLIPALVCVALLALMIIGSVISSPLFRASAYSQLLTVEDGDFTAEVDQISYDQIPLLDAASAQRLGDRKLGELSDMVSQFEVASNYTQINYGDTPVRVTPLEYGDIIKWFNNRAEGLPGYLVIDMVTQEVEIIRLEEGMKYSESELFGRNIYRHLRFNYPTYIFAGVSFEIDDEGVPYYVCPRLVKTIGLFGGRDINGAVLVNAITGESTYYEEVPTWVDQVYFANLVIEQYDYKGMYTNGFINSILGQQGVTVTTEDYNHLAIDDDVYMYTGITSVGSDQSNVGFILTNQRTKETSYYPVAGATEQSAMASAQGEVQNLRYSATFPLLLNISNQPTYFMALKDDAGLVKMYAMVNVAQYQLVAVGNTVSECEANYIKLLSEGNITDIESGSSAEITGKILEIRSAVIDGNSVFYIKLNGDSWYYTFVANENEIAPILDVGDEISFISTSTEGDLRLGYSLAIAE